MADIAAERGRVARFRLPWRLPHVDWRAFVLPIALIAFAEISMIGSNYESDSAAAPSEIIVAGYHAILEGTLFLRTGQTLWAAANGIVIGGFLGLVLGILFGLSSTFDRLMRFTIESIRPVPSAALIPVMLLVFGFGYKMEVTLMIPACTFPVMIFARSAVAGTEPRLMDLSRVLGLSFLERVWKIVLPAALPRIFVGFRLSAALALIVSVTVEVAANPQGLGNLIMMAQQTLQPELMYATLVWLAVIGWALNSSLLWAQRRLFGPAGTVGMKQ